MNPISGGTQLAYLLGALVVLGLAFAGIVWVGRTIRGELGPGAGRGGDPGGLDQLSPAVLKEAIARGLVVPARLAEMSAVERTFLFASLKQMLAAAAAAGEPAPKRTPESPPAATVRQASAPPEPPSPPAELPADLPPAMLAILNAEKFRVWCPMCGTPLELPAFPPLLARCTTCGMKSAIRAEEGGRYVLLVSPPPRGG